MTTRMAASDRDILPAGLKPLHYEISLYDFDFSGDFEYHGTVKIHLQVRSATKQVVLNAHQVKLHQAKVSDGNGHDINSTNISHDETAQTATMDFDKEIAGPEAVLVVQFTAHLNNLMCGFSRAKYKSHGEPPAYVPKEGDSHLMFSTQFEACDCRRALPCFDEPNLKATFDFEIEIPTGLTAISNMPEKGSRPGKEGRTFYSFDRTPIMSTYLLAFAFGDFEYIEAFTERVYGNKPIPVRVYTTRGLKEQGVWGLEHSHKTIDYFSEIFEVEYPLPKIDVLAVHEFAQGAMENWGLITYRISSILFEEGKSGERVKERIAYVVAHELAHQWFGNLVTMDWWNELWLNEGFATWVGWLAVDHFHPDWEYWCKFLLESMQPGIELDSMRASHPVEVTVRSAIEVDQIFDAISYRKGSSMIRMLSEFLGVEVFLRGIAKYLKTHSYGNAKKEDLWSALSEASGKDVSSLMDAWIQKIGFPVLTVTEETSPKGIDVGIAQSRFLATGDVKPDEDETVWWVPLALKKDRNASSASDLALTSRQIVVKDADHEFYKLNSDCVGFYITNYPPARLTKLGQSLDSLSVNDRISLLADAAACARSGIGSVAGLLSLLEGYQHEKHPCVWSQILSVLGELRHIFSDPKNTQALRKFALKLVTPITESMGWEPTAGEGHLQITLRPSLLLVAGSAGHKPTIDEAKKRFDAFIQGKENAFPPTLRNIVLQIGLEQDEKTGYEALKAKYHETKDSTIRVSYMSGMSRVKSEDLVRDMMEFAFSGAVALQDIHTPSALLGRNKDARPIMWKWVKDNWSKVEGALGGTTVAFDRWVRVTLDNFVTKQDRADIEAFFKDKDNSMYARALVRVLDGIESNYKYKDRDEAKVAEWLDANGYGASRL